MYNEEEYDPKIFVDFAYENEYGQMTQMSKVVDADYMGREGELGPLCELFKEFCLAAGFTYLADKKIEWVDDEG